ncbi:hypothetical protein EPUS_00830 [Endocarpon pusillum Z07020]|uniref:Methyltransferase domain-containing protein n=1 Tax=Endocarpon pusillum (strain Z07020 / HMAS-L-300199) TaxID=1263415 RepID=U1HVI6_ENDPU|nr:uncharacterized protein EPUS_00830 [Endocarpon pusillum Z07020]ERF74700.1 hypothetical protein EPUS_00830 [Endocarpon pusillum Z07020]
MWSGRGASKVGRDVPSKDESPSKGAGPSEAAGSSRDAKDSPPKAAGPSENTKGAQSKDDSPSTGAGPTKGVKGSPSKAAGPSKDTKGVQPEDDSSSKGAGPSKAARTSEAAGPSTDARGSPSKAASPSKATTGAPSKDSPSQGSQTKSDELQLSPQVAWAEAIFDYIAPTYDDCRYHFTIAEDFIAWSAPQKGAKVLDLGCGTGIFTFLAADKVGPDGLVIGVDISRRMLQQAKEKKSASGGQRFKNIMFVRDDISNLHDAAWLQRIMTQRGAFDLITGVTCLTALPAPHVAIKNWARLLKPGGRLILDNPSEEDSSPGYVWEADLYPALGLPPKHKGTWTTDIHCLERLFVSAGLEIEKSLRTRNYVETFYEEKEGDRIFEEEYRADVDLQTRYDKKLLRQRWRKVWRRNLDKNGEFCARVQSFVTIGIKR